MADINKINTINLGKIHFWEAKKASALVPIAFPGKNSGNVEAIDSLGVIAYVNIEGVFTGDFDEIQDAINDINYILDGAQFSSSVIYSPFVNAQDSDDNRRQGAQGTNDDLGPEMLIDTTAVFDYRGVKAGDYVKNLNTGEVTTVLYDPTSAFDLVLADDIFTTVGTPYAVTTNINCKIMSFDFKWELPGLSICSYTMSIIQVK